MLKKLSAILLLALFLINLVGYRGWFYFVERQWEVQLQLLLDKEQYNEADLITIKAPLLLPYVTDTREFQRTDGEVNVKGKIYRYVKSKVQNGEYVLLCLPDTYKERIQKAKADFFQDANDLLQKNGSKKPGSSKAGALNILGDYDYSHSGFKIASFDNIRHNYNLQRDAALQNLPHLSPGQPPDLS